MGQIYYYDDNNQEKQYKRQDRSPSPETRAKISNTLKSYNATHPRSPEHSQKIRNGLLHYWQQIPKKDDTPSVENGDIV